MMMPGSGRGVFAASEVPPPHHFSDWGAWSWTIWLIVTVLLFAAAAVALCWFAGLPRPRTYAEIDWVSVGLGATAIAAAVAGVFVHGNVARHIAWPASDRLWLAMPLLVAAVLAWIAANVRGGAERSWVGWVAVGAVVFGGVCSAANDSLNRIAANIPMGVKGLAFLLVLGVVGVIGYGMSQSGRRY